MSEISLDEFVDLAIRVILPILTLSVLWLGFIIANRSLLRSVTPQVECFLRPLQNSPIYEFVIANYGLGSAYNLSLKLEVDEEDFNVHQVIMTRRATEMPFSIIEPGGSVTTIFGVGHSLMGDEPHLKPFKAFIEYEWQPFWTKHPRKVKRIYNLDVRPFKGHAYIGEKNEIAETLKSGLKRIADLIGEHPPRPPIPRDRRSEDRITLEHMESLMPSLFSEMREDLNSSPLKREFILKNQGSTYFAGNKEPLAYFYEAHEDLTDKVGLLVNEGLVTDITYNTVDRYVLSEPLAHYLLDIQKEE